VLAARELDRTIDRLRSELGLGEPFSDPAVAWFGLRNAVFALQDTFLEVVSPVTPDAPAARLIERRGGDCGYMLMFQVGDVEAARGRAAAEGVREVFRFDEEDMEEVHLHPADMRGAIVSLSRPAPPDAWRWGGPDWRRRAVPLRLQGAKVGVADPPAVRTRWSRVLGGPLDAVGVELVADAADPGPIEIVLEGPEARAPFEVAGVRFVTRRS
jgi:hypothetical protein